MKKIILVSSCLLGLKTNYDGGDNCCGDVLQLKDTVFLLPVCPEQLGGLPTPRPAAEIQGGDGHAVLAGSAVVKTACGKDYTASFLRGAEETLRLAVLYGAEAALLKARSPSCGSGRIYDGSFRGKAVPGDGVAAALLKKSGMKVYTEEEISQIKRCFMKDS